MKNSTPAAQWREKGESDPHEGHYDCERARLTLGKYSDDELANGAFMNYDRPLDIARTLAGDPDYHSAICWMTAVKDRIRWLSRSLLKSEQQRDELLKLLKAERDCSWSDEEEHRAAIDAAINKWSN
jgi:hypothetical protein